MVASLTGFGRADFTDEQGRICIELKSVNNRFLQLDFHLPYGYGWLDARLRQEIGKRVTRGKLYMHLELVNYAPEQHIVINEPFVENLLAMHRRLAEKHGEALSINFDGLLALPGVMKVDTKKSADEATWNRLLPVLEKAITEFVESREREGKRLEDDLLQRRLTLLRLYDLIEARVPEYIKLFQEKFSIRIKELAETADIDPSRLNTEIAIWVDKTDVSEEITRIRSHLDELEQTLSIKGDIGRRLDFLVQELHREATTLGNKFSDTEVRQQILDMKCEIEKIREQAQNIE